MWCMPGKGSAMPSRYILNPIIFSRKQKMVILWKDSFVFVLFLSVSLSLSLSLCGGGGKRREGERGREYE